MSQTVMDDNKTIACSTKYDVKSHQEDTRGSRYQVSDAISPLPSGFKHFTHQGSAWLNKEWEKIQSQGYTKSLPEGVKPVDHGDVLYLRGEDDLQ